MVDERFVEYFREWRAKGYSDEQIKSFLLERGNSLATVEDAANASRTILIPTTYTNKPVSVINPSTINTSKRDIYRRRTLTILIVFSVVACIIVVAYFIADKNLNFLSSNNSSDNSSIYDFYSKGSSNNITDNSDIIPKDNLSDRITSNPGPDNLYNYTSNATNNTNITTTYTTYYSSSSGSSGGSGRSSGGSSDSSSTSTPIPTCNDSIQNGDETGIDCGGSCYMCPEDLPPEPSIQCIDGIQNGDEAGIDCGGSCVACASALAGCDCKSEEYCSNGICLLNVSGHTYFVATNGNDNNPGNFTHPFATWQRAVQVSLPGDITYIRGGVWQPITHIMSGSYDTGGIAISIDPDAYGGDFGASGTAQAPIRYYNYPGENPIIDGSLLTTNPDRWQSGISISNAEYIYLKGLTVRHIHQSPPDHNPATNHGKNYSEVFGIGSFNAANLHYENMVAHDIDGRGFQHWSGSWNELEGPGSIFEYDNTSWINCDAYNLYDRYSDSPGNAADGWKVVGSPDNYHYWEGCRAWNYSDDGFDPNGAHRTFKNCWAMSTDSFEGLSDEWDVEGNGFKLTGISPDYAPSYTLGGENFVRVENCIAAFCSGAGFVNNLLINYDDSWPNNGLFYNNLAYRNHGNFWDSSTNNESHIRTTVFRNNIAYKSTYDGQGYSPLYEVGIYNPAIYPHSNNTWISTPEESWPGWAYNPSYNVTDADFVSLDYWQLTAQRKSNGSLPDITFGHLALGSDLIDGGINVGLPYSGDAPDIGAFEYP